MAKEEVAFYILEFIALGAGFSLLLMLRIPIIQQFYILFSILLLYVVVGIIHHNRHHNINFKVVLEYILISVLLITLFVFLNLAKI